MKKPEKTVRAFSYGGGVQSNAVMVLQAMGKVHYELFIFANVGIDSENPDTLAYIENHAKPYCTAHGIHFVEVCKTRRNLQSETLYEYMHRTPRSIPLPMRLGNSGAPGNRACTKDFKIEVIAKYLRKAGFTHFVKGIGFSIDEIHRMRDPMWHEEFGLQVRTEHPLIEARLNRQDCKNLITSAGLPVPPKSSCWFCPFLKRNEWIEMRRNRPELFQKAVELEQMLNAKHLHGTEKLYLHRDMKPLEQAVSFQLQLFDFDALDTCDAGVCMV